MDLRALIFMPALVGAVVFCFVFLLFACNYYLTVLESTGAGGKEVTWVAEPMLDNAWKLAYLGWLFGLWFGPAYIIGRAAIGNAAPWVTLAIPFLILWILYPISQLSSLSSKSIWIPLNPDVFARLLQKPGHVLVFFALSGVTLALFGVVFEWTFVRQGEWGLLFLGAPLVVILGLIYARLLGRLAFALRFTTGLFPTKKKKRKPVAKAEEEPEPVRAPVQPADLPPLNSPEGELVGYNILMSDDPLPVPKKRVRAEVAEAEATKATNDTRLDPWEDTRDTPARPDRQPPPIPTADDDERVAYGVKEAEVVPEERIPDEVVKPKQSELELLSRKDAPKRPKHMWGADLFAFLGQPGTVSAILIASGFCFMVGVMIRVCRDYNPASSPG
jgi:hypothetical protein